MRSAIEVANWLIRFGGSCQISHLKLQKLLFIAFGTHAAEFNKHLFYDPIEAWKYGPVVQSIYHALKFHESSVIDSPIVAIDGSVPMLRDEERDAIKSLRGTLRSFGDLTAYQLTSWSHTKHGPWEKTFDPERGGYQEIDKQLIRRCVIEELGWPVPRGRLTSL